ncbi:MAG: Aminopeptidase [Ignavibacteria bacterium]|nr:Aminopeptidase [Ignavibacteria bacterium]
MGRKKLEKAVGDDKLTQYSTSAVGDSRIEFYSTTPVGDGRLAHYSTIALRDFMGVEESEICLILSDNNMREIGMAFYEASLPLCSESFYFEMKPRTVGGEEPPEQVARIMRDVDVVIAPTSKSLTHTDARRIASDLNVRIGTMPGITIDTMARCFSIAPEDIIELTNKVKNLIFDASEIHIETEAGTEISLPIKGRKIIPSTGVLTKLGESGNLPSGEVYVAPIEGKSNGTIVFDASFAQIGMLTSPITIDIRNGYAEKISGKTEARTLSRLLNNAGDDARQIAEFGIGTNPKAIVCGNILEDEKAIGTIHIAFGNNIYMGGTINVPIHLDGIILSPTVYADEVMIMDKGRLLIP